MAFLSSFAALAISAAGPGHRMDDDDNNDFLARDCCEEDTVADLDLFGHLMERHHDDAAKMARAVALFSKLDLSADDVNDYVFHYAVYNMDVLRELLHRYAPGAQAKAKTLALAISGPRPIAEDATRLLLKDGRFDVLGGATPATSVWTERSSIPLVLAAMIGNPALVGLILEQLSRLDGTKATLVHNMKLVALCCAVYYNDPAVASVVLAALDLDRTTTPAVRRVLTSNPWLLRRMLRMGHLLVMQPLMSSGVLALSGSTIDMLLAYGNGAVKAMFHLTPVVVEHVLKTGATWSSDSQGYETEDDMLHNELSLDECVLLSTTRRAGKHA